MVVVDSVVMTVGDWLVVLVVHELLKSVRVLVVVRVTGTVVVVGKVRVVPVIVEVVVSVSVAAQTPPTVRVHDVVVMVVVVSGRVVVKLVVISEIEVDVPTIVVVNIGTLWHDTDMMAYARLGLPQRRRPQW